MDVSVEEPSLALESRDSQQRPATSIELKVSNLSISIVPQPPLAVVGARSIKRGLQRTWARFSKQQQASMHTNADIDNNAAQDLSQVGLNVLRNINLHVKPGQVCVLLGSSGAGKTTLLNALAGRMDWNHIAMAGRITFNGEKAKKYWKSPK
ncbi:hypothetical protein DFQ26_000879, partial [Actinomortierella ambigua]